MRTRKKKSGLDQEILALGSKASKFAMSPMISAKRGKKKNRRGEGRREEGLGREGKGGRGSVRSRERRGIRRRKEEEGGGKKRKNILKMFFLLC